MYRRKYGKELSVVFRGQYSEQIGMGASVGERSIAGTLPKKKGG